MTLIIKEQALKPTRPKNREKEVRIFLKSIYE
jgi:hypothetical protein